MAIDTDNVHFTILLKFFLFHFALFQLHFVPFLFTIYWSYQLFLIKGKAIEWMKKWLYINRTKKKIN